MSINNATSLRLSQRAASTPAGILAHRCNDLLSRLGIELGLGALNFDQNRGCFLKFDDVVIHLRHHGGDRLEMTSIIAILTQPARAELLEKLLAANTYAQDDIGGILALEPTRRALLLQNWVPVQQTELPQLLKRITAMVDCVERWRKQLPAADARVVPAV